MTTLAQFPDITNIAAITRNGDKWTAQFDVPATEVNRYRVGNYRHGYKLTAPVAKTRTQNKQFDVNREVAGVLYQLAKKVGLKTQRAKQSDECSVVYFLKA